MFQKLFFTFLLCITILGCDIVQNDDKLDVQKIDYPFARYTLLLSVNNVHQVLGCYKKIAFQYDYTFFVYNTESKKFKSIDMHDFKVDNTLSADLNDKGQFVGRCDQGGLLYDINQGTYKIINNPDDPSWKSTRLLKINNMDQIIGYYYYWEDTTQVHYFVGFMYDINQDKFFDINYPGARNTFAHGINDAGQILATYYTGDDEYGVNVLYDTKENTFTKLELPEEMFPADINNNGVIFGTSRMDIDLVFFYDIATKSTTKFTISSSYAQQTSDTNDARQFIDNYGMPSPLPLTGELHGVLITPQFE